MQLPNENLANINRQDSVRDINLQVNSQSTKLFLHLNPAKKHISPSSRRSRAQFLMQIILNDSHHKNLLQTQSFNRRTKTPGTTFCSKRNSNSKTALTPQNKDSMVHKITMNSENILKNRPLTKSNTDSQKIKIKSDGIMYALTKEFESYFKKPKNFIIENTQSNYLISKRHTKLSPCDILNSYVKGQSLTRNNSERKIVSFKDPNTFSLKNRMLFPVKESDNLYTDFIKTVIHYQHQQNKDYQNEIYLKASETNNNSAHHFSLTQPMRSKFLSKKAALRQIPKILIPKILEKPSILQDVPPKVHKIPTKIHAKKQAKAHIKTEINTPIESNKTNMRKIISIPKILTIKNEAVFE